MTATSSDPGHHPPTPRFCTTPALNATGSLSYTPVANQSGVVTITVLAVTDVTATRPTVV